jgi:hypothetical protein
MRKNSNIPHCFSFAFALRNYYMWVLGEFSWARFFNQQYMLFDDLAGVLFTSILKFALYSIELYLSPLS